MCYAQELKIILEQSEQDSLSCVVLILTKGFKWELHRKYLKITNLDSFIISKIRIYYYHKRLFLQCVLAHKIFIL